MELSNPEVYPVTAKFEQDWISHVVTHPVADSSVTNLADTMRNAIGEYEHGSVDVEGVFGIELDFEDDEGMARHQSKELLEMYAAVCWDILLGYNARVRDGF